jgi:uncharacterized membrane protein YebE (DUF533 family)
MFNARDLLGAVMQSGMTQSATDRVGHAMGPQGVGGGDSPLGQIFGQVLGGLGQGGGQGQGGALDAILGKAGGMLGEATGAVKSGNPLAIGGLAALAGAILGGGGDAVKGAVGGGLLAVLGGLAMNVLRNQAPARGQAVGGGMPLGLKAPETAEDDTALDRRALLIVEAMVSAAKADGQIDSGERNRIAGRVKESGAGAEALEFLMDEMQRPLDLAALVAKVTGSEEAIEVYGASLLAIEVDTQAEVDYLRRLAEALGLDANVVSQIHQALGAPVAA